MSRRGFSLIELLVVVSIIATLAAMLLPAIGLVRNAAHSVGCQSNLRQLFLGVQSYVADNEGRVMPVVVYATSVLWADTVADQLDLPAMNQVFTSRSRMGPFNCPANARQVRGTGSLVSSTQNSYAASGYYDDRPTGADKGWDHQYFGGVISSYRRPSELVVMMDCTYFRNFGYENDGGGSTPAMASGVRNIPYDRHRGNANLVYGDGHTGSLRFINGWGANIGSPFWSATSWSNGSMWMGR